MHTLNERRHSGMVRRTRPGMTRFRVRASRARNDDNNSAHCRHRPEIGEIPPPTGRGVKQGAGIGLLRFCEDFRGRTLFDDAAVLHDGDIIADLRRNP